MKKAILLLGLFVPVSIQSQDYSVNWYKIAGGGGTSAGGTYQISGTIGQPDASTAMAGGSYAVTGGFWSLVGVLQTVGAPSLSIARTGNSVIVSWPNTGSYNLQQNANLALTNGWTTSGYSVSTVNGTNNIIITTPTGSLFFRLANP